MAPRRITRLQSQFLDKIFADAMSAELALDELEVPVREFARWLASPSFQERSELYIEAFRLACRALLWKYASAALAQLVGLLASDKEEVRRRASLDLLQLALKEARQPVVPPSPGGETLAPPLSPETATRLLEVLAESESTEQPAPILTDFQTDANPDD